MDDNGVAPMDASVPPTATAEPVVDTVARPELVQHHEPKLPAVMSRMQAGHGIEAIIPRTLEEAFRLAQYICAAKLAPDSYNTAGAPDPHKVTIGIMKALEVGLPPITGLSVIAIINGRPCIWGDGAIALVQRSGLLEKMTDLEIGAKPGSGEDATFADDYGAEIVMWRAGQPEPYVGRFTVGEAKRAKLWANPKRAPWMLYPKRMLRARAIAFAIRNGFADCLSGLAIREEVEDLPAPPKANVSALDDMPKQDNGGETTAAPASARIAAGTGAPTPVTPATDNGSPAPQGDGLKPENAGPAQPDAGKPAAPASHGGAPVSDLTHHGDAGRPAAGSGSQPDAPALPDLPRRPTRQQAGTWTDAACIAIGRMDAFALARFQKERAPVIETLRLLFPSVVEALDEAIGNQMGALAP